MTSVIETKDLTKNYHLGNMVVHALRGISLKIEPGEFVAIMGASGSGKSTLMNLLGCLDNPSSGDYLLDGHNVNSLSRNEYAEIRNQKIGFVFQGFNLLSRTTAIDNVKLPLLYDRSGAVRHPNDLARKALQRVGLGDRMDHEPNQLSGGEQQRVAIARALVNDPTLILADEPTGNLDSRTSVDIMSLFQDLNDQGITIVLVTHEPDIARYAKRVLRMSDGKVLKDFSVTDRLCAADVLAGMPVQLEDDETVEVVK